MCTSTGQRAANGTNAVKSSVRATMRLPSDDLLREEVGEQVAAVRAFGARWACRSISAVRGVRYG